VVEILARLQEPTPFKVKPGEVRFVPSEKSGGFFQARAIPYVDRITILTRLDAVAGEGWKTTFEVIDHAAKAVQCHLDIRTPEGWMTRSDIGGPPADIADLSPADQWKAAATDALKRAAALYGLGRCLSGIEVWVPCAGKNKRAPVFVEWLENPAPVLQAEIWKRAEAIPSPAKKDVQADEMERLRRAQVEHRIEQGRLVSYCRERFGVADPRALAAEQLEALIREINSGEVTP
jgi:hypothetical protein